MSEKHILELEIEQDINIHLKQRLKTKLTEQIIYIKNTEEHLKVLIENKKLWLDLYDKKNYTELTTQLDNPKEAKVDCGYKITL